MFWAKHPAGDGGRERRRRASTHFALFFAAGVAGFATNTPASGNYDFGFYRFYSPDPFFAARPRKKITLKKKKRQTVAMVMPAIAAPRGPVQVVVSIADQRMAVYANGTLYAQSAVSTGKKGHSTPTGVFSVLEKQRHHRSNLYSNAPMPYMQRLTWSGVALHAGELPGYPASHGCIRLPEDFARLLWSATRIGARVIVAPSGIAPVEITHPRLTALSKAEGPVAMELRGRVVEAGELVRTANVAEPIQLTDGPIAAGIASPEPVGKASEVLAAAPNGRSVSILVSRKTGKLQVRQGFKPLFDASVSISGTGKEWGTHVYTALARAEPGAELRWTALSMPSETPRAPVYSGGARRGQQVPAPVPEAKPPQPAEAVLELFEIPKDALERLSGFIASGATLIVSDHAASQETGLGTDFIILTR
jgi:hypothetical protein